MIGALEVGAYVQRSKVDQQLECNIDRTQAVLADEIWLSARRGSIPRLHEVLELLVGEEHLLRDRGELDVDGLGVIVERRRLAENGEGAEERGDGEDPEEETVQHHGHEAPVLVLLRAKDRSMSLR